MPEFDIDFVVRLIVVRCDCLDQATLAEIRNRLNDRPAGAVIDSAAAGRILAAVDSLEQRLEDMAARMRAERQLLFDRAEAAEAFIAAAAETLQ